MMGLKEERKFNDTESKRTRDKREGKKTIEKTRLAHNFSFISMR